VRIGWQKSGYLSSIKQLGVVEQILKPRCIDVRWIEFQFVPPMLEALNTGNIDYGYAGSSPPILAQAASANVYYVAALPQSGRNQAILAPDGSPIRTLREPKGKKVGIGKASSAHNLTVVAFLRARSRNWRPASSPSMPTSRSQMPSISPIAGSPTETWKSWRS
jgi:sulfonate transport system substrate-binding protein